MSTTTPLCPNDGKPIHDSGYLCGWCSDALAEALNDIANLRSELDVTLTRQTRIESSNSTPPPPLEDWTDSEPGVSEQPLMFHLGASQVAQEVDGTIGTWARIILEERGMTLPAIPEPPIGPTHITDCKHKSCNVIRWRIKDSEMTHAARFIATHVWWLRHRPEAPEAYADLTAVAERLKSIIDLPEPKMYAGPCNVCRKDLYARQGAAKVECRECDMVYDMTDRRAYLLECAEDRLERAGHIARAVTELGSPISADRIRVWASRKRLMPHATDGRGRPLYRIGDVLDLLANDTRHKAIA